MRGLYGRRGCAKAETELLSNGTAGRQGGSGASEGVDPQVLFDVDEPEDLTTILESTAFRKDDLTES